MTEVISAILPYKILFSHLLLPVLVASVIFREGWGRKVFSFLGKHTVLFAFLVALSAVIGSLFYSEVLGYEPCVLCWWIRLFLFPQVLLFGVALFRNQGAREVFAYALPLTILALFVSLYFSYYSIGGVSLFPCTTEGGGCDRIFVKEFSYITIPMMSFTVSVYLLLLTWVNKIYRNEK